MTQWIAEQFPFESAGNPAASAADCDESFLKDFQQDATEPARRLLRGKGWRAGEFATQDSRVVRER